MGYRFTALLLTLAAACSPGAQPDEITSADPPPVPDSVRGRPLGVRGAEIGWRDRSAGRGAVVIERKGPDEDSWLRVGQRPPGVFEWVDWGLKPDSTYAYRIASVIDGVESVTSTPLEVKTHDTEIPEPEVRVYDPRAVSPGATLVNIMDQAQMTSLTALLAVDETGEVVWQYEQPGLVVTETEPLESGEILFQYGFTTVTINRKGDTQEAVTKVYVHHDVDVLPWNNLVSITADSVSPHETWDPPHGAADPSKRTIEQVIEIEPVSQKVVEEIRWENIVPWEDVCEACLQSFLFDGADWLHINAVDHDLDEGMIYVSVRNLDRIYKLSYPDGEIQWVMGDGGDFGEGLFSHQHNPTRIGDDRMLLFDNGMHRDWMEPDHSRVVEIEYDAEMGQARIVWEYAGPPAFYSEIMGDASRLRNGNTLIVDSMNQRVIEVTPEGLPVWEMLIPLTYIVYKAHRIENFP